MKTRQGWERSPETWAPDLPAKLIVKMAEGGGLIEGKFFWGGGVII